MSPLLNWRDLKNPALQFSFSHRLYVEILPPKAVDFDIRHRITHRLLHHPRRDLENPAWGGEGGGDSGSFGVLELIEHVRRNLATVLCNGFDDLLMEPHIHFSGPF